MSFLIGNTIYRNVSRVKLRDIYEVGQLEANVGLFSLLIHHIFIHISFFHSNLDAAKSNNLF